MDSAPSADEEYWCSDSVNMQETQNVRSATCIRNCVYKVSNNIQNTTYQCGSAEQVQCVSRQGQILVPSSVTCFVGGCQGVYSCSGGAGFAECSVSPVAEDCGNGVDDDCDGFADCSDSACLGGRRYVETAKMMIVMVFRIAVIRHV
jgi:hypothetical protein